MKTTTAFEKMTDEPEEWETASPALNDAFKWIRSLVAEAMEKE